MSRSVMVKYYEISDLSSVLGEGFFADKAVRTLAQQKRITESDGEILERILRFTEKIQKGKDQVNTGRLSNDAVESIGAYYRAIVTLQALIKRTEEVKEKKLDELINKIREEVKSAMQRKEIDPSEVKNTRTFFEFIRRSTLSESGKYYGSRVEILTWQKRTP